MGSSSRARRRRHLGRSDSAVNETCLSHAPSCVRTCGRGRPGLGPCPIRSAVHSPPSRVGPDPPSLAYARPDRCASTTSAAPPTSTSCGRPSPSTSAPGISPSAPAMATGRRRPAASPMCSPSPSTATARHHARRRSPTRLRSHHRLARSACPKGVTRTYHVVTAPPLDHLSTCS